jgi:hypothetical protein
MKHTKVQAAQWAALVATMITAAPAMAQNVTTYVPEGEVTKGKSELARQGWDGLLKGSGSVSIAQNSSVVGQVDGFSMLFGFNVTGGLDYLYDRHELRNTFSLSENFARTPALDEFLKTNDVLEVESLYNYFLFDWLGPYARLDVKTNVLKTEDVRAEAVDYQINRVDGTTEVRTGQTRMELNGGFKPVSLSQSIGISADPLRDKALAVSLRVGGGARETLAKGALVLDDNADTATILEFKELDNVYQAGAEGFLGLRGSMEGGRLSYEAGGSILFPFLNNDDQNRSASELMRIATKAQVNISVFTWMSINYSFSAINDPQLIDAWQVQNNLLLTVQYTLIERSDVPKIGASGAELEAERKKEAAEEAADEAKAKAAEEKAKAAEAAAKAEEAAKQAEAEKAAADEAARKAAEEQKNAIEAEKKANEVAPANPEQPKP